VNRKHLGTLLWAVGTLAVAFAMFFPILWMVLTSLKTENAAIAFPPQWLFVPTLENWRVAVFGGPVLEFMGNTV
jgi:sorbitol/mannitol transport system permease protein